MRLWVDLRYDLGAAPGVSGDADEHNAAIVATFAAIKADEQTRLIGVSVVSGVSATPSFEPHLRRLQDDLAPLGLADVLQYGGPPNPRALDAADALLAFGPLTNIARLARHGIDVPPMLILEQQFAADPVSAAIVVNAIDHVLILPKIRPAYAAYSALCGRHVVVGKRKIAIGARGEIVFDDDGEDFVEREIVVGLDITAIERELQGGS